jgi:hypothetical protein
VEAVAEQQPVVAARSLSTLGAQPKGGRSALAAEEGAVGDAASARPPCASWCPCGQVAALCDEDLVAAHRGGGRLRPRLASGPARESLRPRRGRHRRRVPAAAAGPGEEAGTGEGREAVCAWWRRGEGRGALRASRGGADITACRRAGAARTSWRAPGRRSVHVEGHGHDQCA